MLASGYYGAAKIAAPWLNRPKNRKNSAELVVAQNRAASYNYHLLERLEAGMVLLGTEVKSLRESKANLRDAYGVMRRGEALAPEFPYRRIPSRRPIQSRPAAIPQAPAAQSSRSTSLTAKLDQKGLTLIPLRIYFREGIAKCELALAQG